MSERTAEHDPISVSIAVDPRTELMSTLWRLAGVRSEYTQRPAKARYIDEIMEYFGPFREHSCVKFVSTVQQRFGAPMALAVHLTDAVSLQERVPFDPIPAGIERNWGPEGHIPASRVEEQKLPAPRLPLTESASGASSVRMKEGLFSWFSMVPSGAESLSGSKGRPPVDRPSLRDLIRSRATCPWWSGSRAET